MPTHPKTDWKADAQLRGRAQLCRLDRVTAAWEFSFRLLRWRRHLAVMTLQRVFFSSSTNPKVLFLMGRVYKSNMANAGEQGILQLLNYLDTASTSWADFFADLTHQTAAMIHVMPPHNIVIHRNIDKDSYQVKIEGSLFNVDYTGSQAWITKWLPLWVFMMPLASWHMNVI